MYQTNIDRLKYALGRAALAAVVLCLFLVCQSSAWGRHCEEAFQALRALQANPYSSQRHQWELYRYEQARIVHLKAEKPISEFFPRVGFTVVERDSAGNATRARIRVLVDNPNVNLSIVSEANRWGQEFRPSDRFQRADGPYYEAVVDVRHGMEYRFVLDGRQVIDPAAEMNTTPEYYERARSGSDPPFLNSIFWDFDRPGAYKMKSSPVDLRGKPLIVAETDPYHLSRNWEYNGARGPRHKSETYRFVAESGLVQQIKSMGYNAIELMPLFAHVEQSTSARPGDGWWVMYQVYGGFGPTSRYGTPDEFAMMVDAFQAAGIAVILDIVPGHFPYQGNSGARSLAEVGLHQWKKGDGHNLFGGEVPTEYGTYRYDYANPFVRRYLVDASMNMMKRYAISGFRLDDPDGIRQFPGGYGITFVSELAAEVRMYRPEAILIAEQFNGATDTVGARDKGGLGYGYRNHYAWFFEVVKRSVQKFDEGIDMGMIQKNIRGIWGDASRLFFETNHDQAANPSGEATGANFATLINGGDWRFVEGKTKAWGALSLLAGGAYLDMPQFRILQEGNLNDSPFVDWSLLRLDSQRGVNDFFSHLSKTIRDNSAFGFVGLHPDIENHIDHSNKVISLARIDFVTGKRYYALINLGSRALDHYQFGIHSSGEFEVIVDGDRSEYRGTGVLASRLPGGRLRANPWSEHQKPYSITVPHLAPYGVILLEEK